MRHRATARRACAEFDPSELLSVKEARRADRFTQLALARVRARRSPTRAGTDELPYDPPRVGCVLGTGHRRDLARSSTVRTPCASAGRERVSPLAVPLMMSNAGAAALSMRHGLRGPTLRGQHRLRVGRARDRRCALRMLQSGEADAVARRRLGGRR